MRVIVIEIVISQYEKNKNIVPALFPSAALQESERDTRKRERAPSANIITDACPLPPYLSTSGGFGGRRVGF